MKHEPAKYLAFDPFFGEEGELACRQVKLVKARKAYPCFTLDGKQDHSIQPGEVHRFEKALVDRSFWGRYRICLGCMDKFLDDLDD